ncbi:hypothetical protein EDC94DRAFT_583048 [Helicostylum pulchrum]|nr:hypothetical protein EDC94DRAFT_583048 [Helicostylum pulchrum]
MEMVGYHQENTSIRDSYAWKDLSQQVVNGQKAHMNIAVLTSASCTKKKPSSDFLLKNENNYLQSLENRVFQETIFSKLTTTNFLEQVNKKKAVASNSAAFSFSCSLPISTKESTEQINKRIEEIEQYQCLVISAFFCRSVGKDNIKVNNNDLFGTIIKRAAMMKHINYKLLTPSGSALVDCGLNCILDLTRGSLTNQHLLFSTSLTNNDLIESRPALRKIDKIFKNSRDAEECYWNSKSYQRKASKFNKKRDMN